MYARIRVSVCPLPTDPLRFDLPLALPRLLLDNAPFQRCFLLSTPMPQVVGAIDAIGALFQLAKRQAESLSLIL